MTKCVGCGAVLQDSDENNIGYTNNLNNKLCQRCFEIKNYNKYVKVDDKDYFNIIKEIDSKNDLILLITDFLNLYNLNELDLKSPVMLIITKADLLPRSINKEKLLSNIKCNLNIVSKIIVSSKNNFNLDLVYNMILKYKKSKNVYVIGYTNAGKSTFVNKMIKNYGGGIGEITMSNLPSTTLDVISNKINDDLFLIDTPGLLDKGSMILKASKETLKKITPKKEIRPIIYQIKNKQSLLIDDLVRIDLNDTNIICYMSNELKFKRIYKDKKSLLKAYKLEIKKDHDLVIKGLGFITFKKDSRIVLYIPDDIDYLVRYSII